MSDAPRASGIIFFLVPFSVACLAPLGIWSVLHTSWVGFALMILPAGLLAWSGAKVVRGG